MVIINLDEIIKNNSGFESLIKAINKVIDLKNENNPSRETKNYLAEQVFELVFYIGKKGIEFTEEERNVIGPLIKEIIRFLGIYILRIGWIFVPDFDGYHLLQRSGIQFLLDNFKEFPVTNEELLGDSLKELQDSEELEIFDERLAAYNKENPPLDYESFPMPLVDPVRPEGVPETHFWWS
jgi:hypothetical protein